MIERYVAHCLWMAERDPAYAVAAARAYSRRLLCLEIARIVTERVMESAS